ncbi:MAG: beta-propeller domain-containing protein, partial [Verrucomicrobiota bacterium]
QGTNTFISGVASGEFGGGGGAPPTSNPGGDAGAGGAVRSVVESDIWRIEGNTLYFFNQYRGLQIIDLSNPDSPQIRGTFHLPAAGEQMYLLDSNHVVLLARDGCQWTSTGPESMALVLSVTDGQPAIITRLPIAGHIQESRLVGTALYVAAQTYRRVIVEPDPNKGVVSEQWEWGTLVFSFDLANPTRPAARNSHWFPGYNNTIAATDRFLFVVTQSPSNWQQSMVRLVDISAADGWMTEAGSVTAMGFVSDKFKLNLNGEILTLISQYTTRNVTTYVETFSLESPAAPRKLGQLQLGTDERLHATRFAGNKVYVVTFHVEFQMDPLWIVDLSDPTRLAIQGQLEIPGWSTYLHPIDDRKLVAVGIETNQTTVSLFSVADATKPELLSRVAIGSGWSWSEANSDEKAVQVLPEANLILLPYQSWTEQNSELRVQIIDLLSNALVKRGSIEHAFQPRRATLHGQRLVSISGKELLTVDATDRDHPVVTSETSLSWLVNQVFVVGDHLIELSNGSSWMWNPEPAKLRVTMANDPDVLLQDFNLPVDLPLIGATVREGKMYLLQSKTDGGWWFMENGQASQESKTNRLVLTVLDLETLPEVRLLGATETLTEPLGWGTSFVAHWLENDLLVWSGATGSGWWWAMDAVPPGGIGGGGGGAAPIGGWPWWGGHHGGRYLAFEVKNAGAPKWLSDLNLVQENRWSFSATFALANLLYVSHQSSEFLEGATLPGQPPPEPVITVDPATGEKTTNQPPTGIWVQRHYLNVIDYSDPQNPTARKPVNIPGALRGVSHSGAIIYTTGQHWDANFQTDWSEWLDASAYDGVAATLVDSLQLPREWPHPLLALDAAIFIGRPGGTNSLPAIETWTLNATGKFSKSGTLQDVAAQTLVQVGDALVAQTSHELLLVNPSTPAALTVAARAEIEGCIGYDLNKADGSLSRGIWIPLGDYGVTLLRP